MRCGDRIAELERALYDLLDTMERGDEFKIQERMRTAGRLLKLPRYLQCPTCWERFGVVVTGAHTHPVLAQHHDGTSDA